jgi:GDPmannose 4,6-dehydratase
MSVPWWTASQRMPTALITGITGQDGGYLAERLVADNWQVHGLVHAGNGQAEQLRARTPSVVLHEGDLAETAAVHDLVAAVEPEEVYNLGGISSVALSWEQPLRTAQVSGLGAGAVLEAAWQLSERSGRAVRVLQASSAEIFGIPERSPQSETTPVAPISPYGAAKAFAHHLVGVYRARGMYAASCILYNHESPRRPAQFVTRKITRAAAMIAAGRQDSLALGNVAVRRDWGWAPDYVDAMVRAIRYRAPHDFVIATGESHSLIDFLATAFAEAGLGDWHEYVAIDDAFTRPVEAAELVGDAGKARSLLNWRPTVSFEEMVRRMVEHDVDDLSGGARQP